MFHCHRREWSLFLVCMLMASPNLWAFQSPDLDDLQDMTLQELLSMEISVGSASEGKRSTLRDLPGIISVITREEIRNMGARDLLDVLRLVPGFFFGVDVQGVVGLGMRGNWGHEGKILLLIDGIEQNEMLFTTLQMGNHYPVDQIKRVEIIRGPGSAVYGGYAELAVINVITMRSADLNGWSLGMTAGVMPDETGRTNGYFAYGKEFDSLAVDLKIYAGQAIRSDRDYTDVWGDSANLANNSDITPSMINAGLSYKGLDIRAIHDRYSLDTVDMFDLLSPDPLANEFNTDQIAAKYTWSLSSSWTLTPKLTYAQQESWKQTDQVARSLENAEALELDEGALFHDEVERLTLSLAALYQPNDQFDVTFGAVHYTEDGTLRGSQLVGSEGEQSFATVDAGKVTYDDTALFAQGTRKFDKLSVTLGARWEDHTQVGSRFVPRVGITGLFGDFHFKALYSRAFRTPGIENIEANADIKAETTDVFEVEAGVQFNESSFLIANIYDITIDDPIVYFFDGDDNYGNFDTVGTRGVELSYQNRGQWGYLSLNGAWYQTTDNQVEAYGVPGQSLLVGAPAYKLTLNTNLKINSQLRWDVAGIYNSSPYGYATVDEEDETIIQKFDSTFLVNTFLNYKPAGVKGFTVGVGAYDLFDEGETYIQPYNNYHGPLPGPSREFLLKLSFRR